MASSSSSSLPASATTSSQSCNYDVFVSFRGEDTSKTFVDHLYLALVDRKVHTYKDGETLSRGESVCPSPFSAIEGSQIAVVVFSKNYADSSWCLDELEYIMKCKEKKGLIVVPIFYDVVPSEVRKQERGFGKGFARQARLNVNKVELWRSALIDATNISGWESRITANGHEMKVIKEVVDTISDKLFSVNSFVDEDFVGMSARLQQLEEQLDIGTGGVRMVGVWGLKGSGKTTITSSLYMKVTHQFQGHCIIEDVRDKTNKHGLKSLQENLLSTLLKKKIELESVLQGKYMIRRKLNHINALVLLDDVDDPKQLDALVGSHDWFGSGSRIIITTRDEHLLNKVDLVCPVKLLSHEEAVMLFDEHAYNNYNPVNDYKKHSSRVVSYAHGLPLTLKVYGSFLYVKNEKEWLSFLSRLKDNPEMHIAEKLKISYDGLKTVQKQFFLDIACLFRGGNTVNTNWGADDTMEVLKAYGSHQSCISQVFLSFRGEDTRKTFVDHLYTALVNQSISTYKDDVTLDRGEYIGPALFSAIERSQIAVVIFSKNYAESAWCLDELEYIMKSKGNRRFGVIPIFYDVFPSEVRKQEGVFGRGFNIQRLKNKNKLESWRKALVDASNIAGWEPKNIANGHEAKVIQEIADTISKILFSLDLYVDEGLVGMSTRLQQLEYQLDIGSGGVRMIGVWGLGGGGKTTLASSLYMTESRYFDDQCIIENVRKESSKHGLKALQETLLSRFLKTKIELQSVVEGKHMIRRWLKNSRVFIFLDDVDDRKQLDALVGSHNWFGSGSRIIITTRDEHLLRTHKVDFVCPVTLLSDEEAIMLFNKLAYNKDKPLNDYKKLSSDVVSYAAGLPLAIKVLGSFLYDKNENDWLRTLSRLRDIPKLQIVELFSNFWSLLFEET